MPLKFGPCFRILFLVSALFLPALAFAAQNGKTSDVRWELSGVKIGPQPPDLFEPPAGYSKLPPEAVAPLLGLRLKSKAKQ